MAYIIKPQQLLMQAGDANEQEELIYEEQPIPQIEDIEMSALNNFSQQFRISYKQIEQHAQIGKPASRDTQVFHNAILKLIEKLQPSKIAISSILELTSGLISSYYPSQERIKLLSQAKEKNILVLNRLSVQQESLLFKELRESLQRFKRCLLVRESQLGMVLFIEDNQSKYPPADFQQIYAANFSEIIECVIPVERCLEPINFKVLSRMLQHEYSFFDDFSVRCGTLQKELESCQLRLQKEKLIKKEQEDVIKTVLRHLKIITSKISTIAQLFPYACLKHKEDLFSFQLIHPRWQKLFEDGVIFYKIYGDSDKVDKSFTKLKDFLNIINATMNILNQEKDIPNGTKSWGARGESAMKVIKCTLFKSTAFHEAELMISDPDQTLAKEIWNLPEKKELKKFIELSLPSISFSPQLFIPRMVRLYFFYNLQNNKTPLPSFEIDNLEQYYHDLFIQKPHNERLSIRINNFFELQLRQFKQVVQQKSFFKKQLNQMSTNLNNFKNIFKKKHDPPKAVIFHIHGGGFISMSSFIHQTYTRNWANSLNVPIVSVDYGKAPEYPYPQGLYDCLEAYLWTLHCMQQIYDFQPVKIILVGDSAGGNLVAALTSLLISWGLRVPDGIVLAYPALNLDYYDYTPSLLTALNDMILPHTFLKICLKSYLKDPQYRPQSDWKVSPLLTPNAILEKYPPTRIFVGSKDPFHDDCCRFAQKINNAQPKKVKLVVIQQFPHGFLQFDLSTQPHFYCREATKQVEGALEELLK